MRYLFVPSLLAALSLLLSVALCNSQNVAMGWYATWAPPSSISPKFNTITFAFAILNNDTTITPPTLGTTSPPSTLAEVVKNVQKNGSKAIISIGGSTASLYFSTAVNPANRTIFVKAVVALMNGNGYDGVEIDWEFPGEPNGCNLFSPNDSSNFLDFLQELRQTIGPSKTISVAVNGKPWLDSTGNFLTDVSAYADVLDWATIMNYDLFGPWNPYVAGPNAPVNDSCAPLADQTGSAVADLTAWTNAKFPPEKILLGVPFYSRSFNVAPDKALTSTGAIALYQFANATLQPMGSLDQPPYPVVCGNATGPSGVSTYASMFADNYITGNGSTTPSGVDYFFDTCSETPFLYISSSDLMISFDNAESFGIKGQFIRQNGLKGFAAWYVGADHNDILVDAISSGMGNQQCSSS